MKKSLFATSILLACFIIIQVFAFCSSAITLNNNSYYYMSGRLIPNWYYLYSGSVVASNSDIKSEANYVYTTHFFNFRCDLDVTTFSSFSTGTYNVITGPIHYSDWWASFGSNPSDSTTSYYLPSGDSGVPMTNNGTYNLLCTSETHTSECLAWARFEYYIKDASDNSSVISDYIMTRHVDFP